MGVSEIVGAGVEHDLSVSTPPPRVPGKHHHRHLHRRPPFKKTQGAPLLISRAENHLASPVLTGKAFPAASSFTVWRPTRFINTCASCGNWAHVPPADAADHANIGDTKGSDMSEGARHNRQPAQLPVDPFNHPLLLIGADAPHILLRIPVVPNPLNHRPSTGGGRAPSPHPPEGLKAPILIPHGTNLRVRDTSCSRQQRMRRHG